jgi:hypothetical protein
MSSSAKQLLMASMFDASQTRASRFNFAGALTS